MRIGVMAGASGPEGTIEGMIARAKDVEARGFDSLWMANIFGLDAIGTLAVVGHETSRIELGTAVVPTYPRHPIAIGQQALTTQAASGGRFTLGIGLSHKIVIEDLFGLDYSKPARHMRDYLAVLGPMLRGEPVKHDGPDYRVNVGIEVPDAKPVPLLVAALGPVMLGIAGSLSDGTITWMTGPATIESHIAPKIHDAATKAGRPAPRVVCGLPVVLTNDVDAARERVGKTFAMYGTLPSYRAMLDREGAAGPADVSLVGDEASLRAQIGRLKDAGVTDFNAAITPLEEGALERTVEFLASLG